MSYLNSTLQEIIPACVSLSETPDNNFFEKWTQLRCHEAMSSAISHNPDDRQLIYNPDNQQYVEESMTTILNNYSKSHTLTDNTSAEGFSNFQYELLSVCIDQSMPGVCDTFLDSYCSSVSRQDATDDRFLSSLCGCYVPPDPTYLQYTTGTIECLEGLPGCVACEGDGCYGQPACDPLCHRALTVQKYNKNVGSVIDCPQNVCVIDGTNASVGNTPISFINVCTGCQEGDGCICIVNEPDELNDNVYSLCGPDSVYIVNGEVVPEPPIKVDTNVRITWGLILIILIAIASVTTYILIKHGKDSRRLQHTE